MKIITLTVTEAEAELIGNALFARPYAEVSTLIDKLRNQIVGQRQAPVGEGPVPADMPDMPT